MDLLVAHDRTEHGDAALRAAAVLSERSADGLEIGVVLVLGQIDLDATGELSGDAKRAAAVERAFPEMWRRVESVLESEGRDPESVSVDVVVRVAATHLVRSQAKIAEELVETARAHGARRLVLGRMGRPDGVAEHLLGTSTRAVEADLPHGVLILDLAE